MKLLNGNCLDLLPFIPDDSVDVTITSPPYNMNLRIRNGKYCSRQIVKELSTKYKNYDDNLDMQSYYEFNKKVLEQLLRVSNLVFYNIQIITGNKPAIFKLMGDFSNNIKELIIWDKVNSQPAIGEGVLNSQYELIIVLSKDAISRKFKEANFKRGTLNNIWEIKRSKKRHPDHGAVFPIELVNKIIDNFTKEGDVILDPFMGTGTVGESCKIKKREFIGIELDVDYYNYCKELINNG